MSGAHLVHEINTCISNQVSSEANFRYIANWIFGQHMFSGVHTCSKSLHKIYKRVESNDFLVTKLSIVASTEHNHHMSMCKCGHACMHRSTGSMTVFLISIVMC